MKIYTRTGDDGQTSLWGGQRVAKDSLRVAAYGTVDELNALLGVARSSVPDAKLYNALARIQNELFVVGADLATPGETTRIDRIGEHNVTRLEKEIDDFEGELEPLRQFILPGGTSAASYLHLARTICRRAEREIVKLAADETINQLVLHYINRLSDWLFVTARLANAHAGMPDMLVTYNGTSRR
jgi:cob(I)alamin adenosyltransferase